MCLCLFGPCFWLELAHIFGLDSVFGLIWSMFRPDLAVCVLDLARDFGLNWLICLA